MSRFIETVSHFLNPRAASTMRQEHDQSSPDIFETDVLVIGGGMGGMTVAASAASQGANVVVVEIAKDLGGSALISQGYVSIPPSLSEFLADDPQGDAKKYGVLAAELPAVFRWLASLDVWLSPPLQGILGYCAGHQIDVPGYFGAAQRIIEGAGGIMVRNTVTERLLVENGVVAGAYCRDQESGTKIVVRARSTVIATGGFQASDAARRRYLPKSKQFVTRSNPHSVGDGLRLAIDAGASLSPEMQGFYGHLLPYPLPPVLRHADFTRLAFYESSLGVLLDSAGRRFCDESCGDHINAQRASEVGRAVLIVDEEVRLHGMATLMPGGNASEKWDAAAKAGANVLSAPTIEKLCNGIESWGYDGDQALATLSYFNARVGGRPADLVPPRKRNHRPLVDGPFYAVEVQAGITLTNGGLRNDVDGRVLDASGKSIPGLFVAGVDAGGFNRDGYSGALARCLVFGRRAAAAALTSEPIAAECNLP
jgi:succinate dehydrogenase/fumarate reductase flavoprotein subunit